MKTKEQRQALRLQRQAFENDNAVWLLPLRDAFHTFLEQNGYATASTPAAGSTYPGSHAQGLWECWLAATLRARPELPGPPKDSTNHQQ